MTNLKVFIKTYWLTLALLSVAWILTLIPFVLDGRYICIKDSCGFSIGTNYRDGVWFLAVAETSFLTIPFRMPIYSGAPLQGYHYVPNLAAYLLTYMGIPVTMTYFQLIPILYISLLTIIVWQLAKGIHNSRLFLFMLFFFVLFGMHLAPWTSLYHKGYIDNSALINTFQATRLLESPHTALSLLILFYVLLQMYLGKYFSNRIFYIFCILIVLIIGTKVYVAFTLIGLMTCYEFVHLIQKKSLLHFFRIIYLMITAICGYLFFYYTSQTSSTAPFIFSPFATVHHLIESDGLFHQPRMVLARYFLYEHGMSARLLAIELYSTLLFILYYFGIRTIGLAYLLIQLLRRKISAIEISAGAIIIADIAIAVLYIQRGDWYNPIQFAVPAAYLCAIYTAVCVYKIMQRYKRLGILILAICIMIALPGNLVNAQYLNNKARYLFPLGEMEILTKLKYLPDGPVYYPIDENDMAYVPAFTGKPGYVNFLNVLENAGIDYTKRLDDTKDPEKMNLEKIDVTYFYIPKRMKTAAAYQLRLAQSNMVTMVAENNDAVLYRKK